MSDSTPVEVNLDTFEKQLNGNASVVEVEVPDKEGVSEPTPSATKEVSEPEDEGTLPEDEGDDGEDTPEEKEEPKEDDKSKKRRKSAQERINDLTREKYELQRLLDLERVEARRQEPAKEKPSTTVAAPEGAPNPDALTEDGKPIYPMGEFDPQFIADLSRHTFKEEREKMKKEMTAEENLKQFQSAQQELTQQWQTKVEASAERLPDLQEKFGSLQETFKEIPVEYGEFLASSIMMLDNGPDVLNYFADNLDEAARVISEGPFKATIALGRLDAKFAKAAEGVDKGVASKATQAPPPPPSNKGLSVAKDIRPDTDNLDDFEKLFYKK